MSQTGHAEKATKTLPPPYEPTHTNALDGPIVVGA